MNRLENPDTMRLFFALWPDENTRAQLTTLQQGLRGRKTRHANLHMTLAFLGNQPESLLPMLKEILKKLTVPDMTLEIDRLGYFSRQRIAWAGMEQVPVPLLELHGALNAALEQSGIAFDRRPDFKPHVTLARDASPPENQNFAPIRWHECHLALVQSLVRPAGISYEVLASLYCTPSSNAGFEKKEEPR
jgi:RNA 2',3'-cyclic 3'-phosphodiesterase